MTSLRRAGLVVGILGPLLGALAWAPPAYGQINIGGFNMEGDAEAGGRYFIERPSPTRRGKFEEYRDINQGVFLNELRLRFFRPDDSYSFGFGGANWGLDNQEYALRAGRLGVWEFTFDWDETPHLISTTARTRTVEVSPGVFKLPFRPDATSISPAEGALYNAGREVDVGVRWDTARIAMVVTPTPELEFRSEYTRIHKGGDLPFGVAMGSPGNDFIEVFQPIDQNINDVRLRSTIARENWQLQVGYNFSKFENANNLVIADNPLRQTFSAFVPSATGGSSNPAFGQSSLPPDNQAHTIYLGGGVDLPWRTRVNGSFSYSLRLQDDNFLPYTINPNIANFVASGVNPAIPTGLLTLPQDSLEGKAGIATLNVNAVNRAIPHLTLGLRFRYFNHDEMTDEITFPVQVVNDQTLTIEERQNSAFSYQRYNVDTDAKYRVTNNLATTVGGGWERMNRAPQHREVPQSDDYYAKLAVDWTATDWLLTRLTYRPSWRRIDEYNTFAHIAHTSVEEELSPNEQAQSQSTLLRKYDEAARNRQQVDLLLQFTPTDNTTIGISGGWRSDNYQGGQFGLLEATTWSAGFDASWTPVDKVVFFGGYVYENSFQKIQSRNRDVATVTGVPANCTPIPGTTPTQSSCVSDFPDWNWISNNIDQVQTAHIGANVALIPRKLEWSTTANYSYALGSVDNRNPTVPLPHPAQGFPSTANAVARRQPAYEDSLIRLDTAIRYWFTKEWALSVGYAFETFEKHDWRTDTLNPWQPGSNSIFLGNDSRDYTAHIIGATVRYVFK